MWNNKIKTTITFFLVGIFLLSGVNSGFSQEPFLEISDEDLDLLEELLEEADDLFYEENYTVTKLLYVMMVLLMILLMWHVPKVQLS